MDTGHSDTGCSEVGASDTGDFDTDHLDTGRLETGCLHCFFEEEDHFGAKYWHSVREGLCEEYSGLSQKLQEGSGLCSCSLGSLQGSGEACSAEGTYLFNGLDTVEKHLSPLSTLESESLDDRASTSVWPPF